MVIPMFELFGKVGKRMKPISDKLQNYALAFVTTAPVPGNCRDFDPMPAVLC